MQSTEKSLSYNSSQVKSSGSVNHSGSSFSSKEEFKPWQITGRKCSCRSSWCPVCWGLWGNRALLKRLGSMDWSFVRHIVLTVGREKGDPKQVFDEVVHKRGIGNLIKNLERTDQVNIIDWVVVLEWHPDGYPHWHFFVEVESKGKAGMIGKNVISGRWSFGLYVYETYFKSEFHWNKLIGYFGRNGYFDEGKGHQGKLPQWALERDKRIKRWESKKGVVRMRQDQFKREGLYSTIRENSESLKKIVGEYSSTHSSTHSSKTYEMKLSECGKRADLMMSKGGDVIMERKINTPYERIKKEFPWKYVEGKGLILDLTEDEMIKFWERISEIESELGIDFIDAGIEKKERAGGKTECTPLRENQ